MKILTLIVHASAQQALADRLRTLEHVPGFTFTHVEGHGVQVESDPFLSVRDKVVGYTPRVRVDILLDDAGVDAVLAMLREAGAGSRGQGVLLGHAGGAGRASVMATDDCGGRGQYGGMPRWAAQSRFLQKGCSLCRGL